MHPFLNIAVKAARSASKIIIKSFERIDRVKIFEKAHNDFVSEVDQLAEQEIIQIIREAYPNHAILGEEGGEVKASSSSSPSFPKSAKKGYNKTQQTEDNEYVWIVDPIDGTVNYIHGYPHFAVSIAVRQGDKILCGLTYDPIAQEIYTAENGGGAFCNNKRLRVSQHRQLDGSLLGIGFAHTDAQRLKEYIQTLSAIELYTAGIRRSGSSTLDLAYVASGKLDGMWAFNLKPWDLATGSLLVTEAGGMASDFTGNNKYFTTGNVIAGNPYVYKELLQTITKCLAG